MLIKQAVKILLFEDAGLQSLVSNRIFPLRIPQKDEYPAITWGRINRNADIALSSDIQAQRRVTDWFEFVSFAQGARGATSSEDIDDALFELLHGFAGTVSDGESPESTLFIEGIFLEKVGEYYRDDLQQYATRSVYRVHSVRNQRS